MQEVRAAGIETRLIGEGHHLVDQRTRSLRVAGGDQAKCPCSGKLAHDLARCYPRGVLSATAEVPILLLGRRLVLPVPIVEHPFHPSCRLPPLHLDLRFERAFEEGQVGGARIAKSGCLGEEKRRAGLDVVGRGEGERSVVMPRRGSMCGRGRRLASSLGERGQCPGHESGGVLTDRVAKRECLGVVIRQ